MRSREKVNIQNLKTPTKKHKMPLDNNPKTFYHSICVSLMFQRYPSPSLSQRIELGSLSKHQKKVLV